MTTVQEKRIPFCSDQIQFIDEGVPIVLLRHDGASSLDGIARPMTSVTGKRRT